MSRGIGTGGGVWYDGYSFHGAGIVKDVRHTHSYIHRPFRTAAYDRAFGDGCGASGALNPLPPRPRTKKPPTRVSTAGTASVGYVSFIASAHPESSAAMHAVFDAKLRAIYARHAVDKQASVTALLRKWSGREDELLERVITKYRAERDDQGPLAKDQVRSPARADKSPQLPVRRTWSGQ